MVDMAGNREILGKLHGELRGKMIKCLTVGMTHWDNGTTAEDALGQAMLREEQNSFSLQRTFKSELETGDMMFMQKKQIPLWLLELCKVKRGCRSRKFMA